MGCVPRVLGVSAERTSPRLDPPGRRRAPIAPRGASRGAVCGIRRTMRYLITVTENISLLLGRDRRHRKLWRREGGAGGVPTNTRGRAPRVPETSTAMSDDDEVTEEVLARLSREMAETVRVSLRQGEPEAVVDSQVAGEDDAPGPRTSAVSWSSRENPDDDDIMISALVSAMAKGREISASLGGGTDPVRVMVNLDAAEPPNPSGSRSSSVQRERVGFGSSAPRVTAPKVPSDADVTGPGLAYANVENLSRVSRPNAPGTRWGKPPPRRPALAESLAPSSTRARRRASRIRRHRRRSRHRGRRGGHRGPRVGGQEGGG